MLQYLPLFKALHLVGVIGWFAGLFYLVRILVYHVEAMDEPQPKQDILKAQYNVMEWRVYKIICNQGMLLTWLMGLLMMYAYGLEWLKASYWLHTKLFFVALLTAYHFYCKRIIQLLEMGARPFTSFQLRLLNEVPSVFMILVLLLAFYKNSLNWGYTILGIAGFVGFIVVVTKLYKKHRDRKK